MVWLAVYAGLRQLLVSSGATGVNFGVAEAPLEESALISTAVLWVVKMLFDWFFGKAKTASLLRTLAKLEENLATNKIDVDLDDIRTTLLEKLREEATDTTVIPKWLSDLLALAVTRAKPT